MRARKRRDRQVFRRLDPELARAAGAWADAMTYPRELTPEAADVGAAAHVEQHPEVPIEDARAVFRKEAAYRAGAPAYKGHQPEGMWEALGHEISMDIEHAIHNPDPPGPAPEKPPGNRKQRRADAARSRQKR